MSGGGQPRSWPSDADVRRAGKRGAAKLDQRYRGDWATHEHPPAYDRVNEQGEIEHHLIEPTPPPPSEGWEHFKAKDS